MTKIEAIKDRISSLFQKNSALGFALAGVITGVAVSILTPEKAVEDLTLKEKAAEKIKGFFGGWQEKREEKKLSRLEDQEETKPIYYEKDGWLWILTDKGAMNDFHHDKARDFPNAQNAVRESKIELEMIREETKGELGGFVKSALVDRNDNYVLLVRILGKDKAENWAEKLANNLEYPSAESDLVNYLNNDLSIWNIYDLRFYAYNINPYLRKENYFFSY